MKNTSYSVKANEFTFSFTEVAINNFDIVEKHPGEYNMLLDQLSVNIKVVASDLFGKHQTVEVDGETFDIVIKDELDLVLDQMGFNSVSSKLVKEIKAPMPGLVLEIAVIAGQQVAKGDKILILEAMKMENSILIPADATIKSIAVTAGQSVEKGQMLVELE